MEKLQSVSKQLRKRVSASFDDLVAGFEEFKSKAKFLPLGSSREIPKRDPPFDTVSDIRRNILERDSDLNMHDSRSERDAYFEG